MSFSERVAAEPFVAWCQEQLRLVVDREGLGRVRLDAGGPVFTARCDLARRIGVEERSLWRYLRGLDGMGRPTTTLPRCKVEDMLHRADVDFYDVYPEFLHERDIELEPDGWCPRCREMTTPQKGLCLWCDTLVKAAPPVRRKRRKARRGSPRKPEPLRHVPTAPEIQAAARAEDVEAVQQLAVHLGALVDEKWSYGDLAA